MIENIERMLICEVCGDAAVMGFGMTLDGLRMGDVGHWRCAEHHPHREPRYTREDWAQARAEGRLYPEKSSYVAKPTATVAA